MFHDEAYVSALELGSADARFALEFDAHPFPGLLDHCKSIAGATLSAAAWLSVSGNERRVAINWTGGRHHARSDSASGWCFVNDVVLSMLLFRKKGLVKLAYFDMDIHAGDAVEEACTEAIVLFLLSCSKSLKGDSDVLYVSTHLFEAGFFPYPSGCKSEDNVHNFPMKRGEGTKAVGRKLKVGKGLCDKSFMTLFGSKIMPLLEAHGPEVLILQMGADGLAGDPVGEHFNLTEKSFVHVARCVRGKFKRILLLGGGGYNHVNTAKCWAHVTAAVLGVSELPHEVPEDVPRFAEFGPDFIMTIRQTVMKDLND